MSDFVDINVTDRVITMFFGAAIPTDNVKTSISLKDVKSVSMSKDNVVIVTLKDNRVWQLSSLNEMIEDTYPVENWNSIELENNEDLFNKIENIIL
jgi:hypothetical protein